MISVLCGVMALIGIPFLKETYAPVIRLRLAKKAADPEEAIMQLPKFSRIHDSKLQMIWLNLSRPIYLLTHSIICFTLSLYMAL